MNIALPAIVSFFVFLPGIIARARFLLIGHELSPSSPFNRVVIDVFLLSAIFHGIWITGSILLCDRYLALDPFLHLLGSDADQQSESLSRIATDAEWILLYFGTLIPACWLIPSELRNFIIRHRLDSAAFKWNYLFRFNDADWYYILDGTYEKNEPDLIYVSAIVQVVDTAILYEGHLSDYHLNKDGSLDYLTLKDATRYDFKKFPDDPKFRIDGNVFVLRFKEIITLNIKYVDLSVLNNTDKPTQANETSQTSRISLSTNHNKD